MEDAFSKKCNKCSKYKNLTDFYRDRLFKDGRTSICKSCKNKKTDEWRINNREKYNSDMRAYNKKHYQRLRVMRYGIKPEQYEEMFKRQKGKCAICKKSPKTKIRSLAIDHCHTTNKVRGLLCFGCNRAISILDNKEMLKKATDYLNSPM